MKILMKLYLHSFLVVLLSIPLQVTWPSTAAAGGTTVCFWNWGRECIELPEDIPALPKVSAAPEDTIEPSCFVPEDRNEWCTKTGTFEDGITWEVTFDEDPSDPRASVFLRKDGDEFYFGNFNSHIEDYDHFEGCFDTSTVGHTLETLFGLGRCAEYDGLVEDTNLYQVTTFFPGMTEGWMANGHNFDTSSFFNPDLVSNDLFLHPDDGTHLITRRNVENADLATQVGLASLLAYTSITSFNYNQYGRHNYVAKGKFATFVTGFDYAARTAVTYTYKLFAPFFDCATVMDVAARDFSDELNEIEQWSVVAEPAFTPNDGPGSGAGLYQLRLIIRHLATGIEARWNPNYYGDEFKDASDAVKVEKLIDYMVAEGETRMTPLEFLNPGERTSLEQFIIWSKSDIVKLFSEMTWRRVSGSELHPIPEDHPLLPGYP